MIGPTGLTGATGPTGPQPTSADVGALFSFVAGPVSTIPPGGLAFCMPACAGGRHVYSVFASVSNIPCQLLAVDRRNATTAEVRAYCPANSGGQVTLSCAIICGPPPTGT